MSSIPYSGGTIVDTEFTTTVGTRREIVDAISTQLQNAGWSVISGGGSATVILRSGETASPKSNSIRVRLNDAGSGNCAQLRIENDSGTLTSQNFFLLPGAGKVFRIIACQYNFFVFTEASEMREYVAAGTLHIPDFLNGVVTGSLGWMQANAISDVDATNKRASFRTRLAANGSGASPDFNGWGAQIRNGVLLNWGNSNNQAPAQSLVVPERGYYGITGSAYRWSDDSLASVEAIMCFGIANATDEAKRQGLIHNAMVISDSFGADTVPSETYDGHTWHAITSANTGSTSYARGTLFIATS